MIGLTHDTTIGVVACWYTGLDTNFESGSSIVANLSFKVASDSDLVFTNYLVAMPPAGDPDRYELSLAFSSGDIIDYLTSLHRSINNFASSIFPVPVDNNGSSSNLSLSATGQNIIILVVAGSILLLIAGAYLGYSKYSKAN